MSSKRSPTWSFLWYILNTGEMHCNSKHFPLPTVSPKNYPAVSNLLKGGLVIKGLKEKYGGKLRYILYQNLAMPISRGIEHTITIKNTDIEGQRKALMQGYYGYEARKQAGSFETCYGR